MSIVLSPVSSSSPTKERRGRRLNALIFVVFLLITGGGLLPGAVLASSCWLPAQANFPACSGQPHDRADRHVSAGRGPRIAPPANGVHLPPVYSGHNGFWYWGPPPDFATNAVVVGDSSPELLSRSYARCEVRSTVTSPPGVSNDLTGHPSPVVHWSAATMVGALAGAPAARVIIRSSLPTD